MSRESRDDDMIIIIIASVILAMILLVTLKYFSSSIKDVFGKIKIIETAPFLWWSQEWRDTSSAFFEGSIDLSKATFANIAYFYNRWIAWIWLVPCYFCFKKVSKMVTKESFKHKLNPQSLIETTSKIFTTNIPWVHRDLTKVSMNVGTWRLMESPLLFLVKNRAILDETGKPFKLNMVYETGDTDALYNVKSDFSDEDILAVDPLLHDSFTLEKDIKAAFGGPKLKLPERVIETPDKEIKKFKDSDLIPTLHCPYLNTKDSVHHNFIDERRLKSVLITHVGERMTGNPFEYIRNLGKEDSSRRWLYGLAVALYLHGFSDKTKKDATDILNAMNISAGGTGKIDPSKINIGKAESHVIEWRKSEAYMMQVDYHKTFLNVFFMALIKYARIRGVIATYDFGWLKAFDRTLWYAMNQMGRVVASPEAAGAWSHFYAEEAIKKPLDEPYLEIAVEGFRNEMIAEGYLNEEFEEERKKRINEKKAAQKYRDSICARQGFKNSES